MASPGNISATFAPLVINGQQLNGGFSFNFALPDMQAITDQAYNFMQQNNAQDFGFVGQTIGGSQNFLQNQVTPILAGAQNQINANPAYIAQSLTMENQLAQSQMGYEYALQQQSIAAQAATAQASIASSQASAQAAANSGGGGGGGCFITTAVCEFEGLPDDCYTLNTLRWFRDGYVKSHHPDLVVEYYAIAPDLVAKLNAKKNRAILYETIRMAYIEPCLSLIESGEHALAVKHYEKMVQFVKAICDE